MKEQKKRHPYTTTDVSPMSCICCGADIAAIHPSDLDKYDLDSQMWDNGIVGIISAGYGSNKDGDVYCVAICDNCIEKARNRGDVIYLYNYMGVGDKVNKEIRNDYNKALHRKIKLKRILKGCENCGGEIEERDNCLICVDCGLAKSEY